MAADGETVHSYRHLKDHFDSSSNNPAKSEQEPGPRVRFKTRIITDRKQNIKKPFIISTLAVLTVLILSSALVIS